MLTIHWDQMASFGLSMQTRLVDKLLPQLNSSYFALHQRTEAFDSEPWRVRLTAMVPELIHYGMVTEYRIAFVIELLVTHHLSLDDPAVTAILAADSGNKHKTRQLLQLSRQPRSQPNHKMSGTKQ